MDANTIDAEAPTDAGGARVETVANRIFHQLREDILLGRIAPGQSLTIRGLAEQMGVSAMPVREALRRLIAEQALEMQDNRRVRIPAMTIDRFEDLLAARVTLETEAAERALPYIDEARLRLLEQIDQEVNDATHGEQYDRWMDRNFAFHACIYEARPGSAFRALIESVWLQLGPFMRQALIQIDEHYPEDRHAEALNAIRERNRTALRIAIEADIRDGISHIGNLLIREEAKRAQPRRRRPAQTSL